MEPVEVQRGMGSPMAWACNRFFRGPGGTPEASEECFVSSKTYVYEKRVLDQMAL